VYVIYSLLQIALGLGIAGVVEFAAGGSGVAARTSALRVLGQQGHPREGLGATGAGVLLDVRVGLQMGPQIRAIGEGPVAVLAAEGLLARVGANVSLEEPWSGEGLAAQVALAGQRVGANVHLQSSQGNIGLVAILAAEGLLHLVALGGGAVELLVLGQAREGGVGFLAVRALVTRRLALVLLGG